MAAIKSNKDKVSPEAVLAKTGKSIGDWYAILDAFDVAANGHKAAAKMLADAHGVSPWWCQCLTVQYEQECGLREPGQRHGGSYIINVSKTIAAPAQAAFDAWASAEGWNGWFTTGARVDFQVGGAYANDDKDHGVFTKIRPPGEKKSMGEVARIEFTWENAGHCPGSKVIVQFLDKGPDKTAVAVTHDKLPDPKGCEDMKDGWGWALTSLKSWLETGRPVRYEDWKAQKKA